MCFLFGLGNTAKSKKTFMSQGIQPDEANHTSSVSNSRGPELGKHCVPQGVKGHFTEESSPELL